ncbi:tyrosine-protein phosphatase YwqE [Dyadobacter jejuensis]|uniref:protein-tyrosine-phosphatase n=1 Tax=Dyadobacter jejuensis TaxID=1082580 RepID=A0A316AJ18_9BACT|nr:CpsB/CapC family capsule biosynthesis tyrosine phosphatase [Dyadobacter jejuensis]PWJ57631.1 tyrosine-protein phosphatase YwqE [Dyadobacter jejuensis]
MLETIGTDLHIHALPGIDDGSRNIEESKAIITKHYQSGMRRIITTPHIRSDLFLNNKASIQAAFDTLAKDSAIEWPELELSFAAEYYADDHFVELLDRDEILPLFGPYVLVETSMRLEQPLFTSILRRMIDKRWKPVLAHPERYRPWWDHKTIYDEVYEMEVIFQVNLLSLAGKYGPKQQEVAETLIEKQKIKAIGSDLHRISQYDDLHRATQNPYYDQLIELPLLNRNELG